MRLVGLEVWNWRGLDHAALEGLAPDLNLVVGPNESGKSRLFEALRFALFERYKGESEEKKRLRTWGGSESPTVEVAFEIGGRAWKVHKRFLKGATARLDGPGTSLTDEDAEEKLRQLWGTREIKGRKEIDQFLGLWPLLWVQQGRAGVAPHADLNDESRGRLSDALTTQVAEVAKGRAGQRVLERAEAERARYWTPTWKERGELQAARERRDAAKVLLDQKATRRKEAHAAADELARTLTVLAEGDAKLRAQRLRVEQANARVTLAQGRRATLLTRELEAKSRHADRELWHQKARERAQLEGDTLALAAAIAEREAVLAKLDTDGAEREVVRTRTREETERAEHGVAEAKASVGRAAARERRGRLRDQAEAAHKALEDALEQRSRLRTIEEELRTLRTGPGEMKALRRAKETWARASASLAAAAARVTLRALRPLVIDGEPLAEGAVKEWQLDEATAILLEGVAELHVSPAGAELHRLRDAERDARQLLDAQLGELGVVDVAEAEEQHRRRIELEAERKHPEAFLGQLGVGGVEKLEASVRALEGELAGGEATGPAPFEAVDLTSEAASLALARAE